MTPNQISSFIIFGASFYLGLFLRNRKKLHVSPENKITARAEIFPKSRFLEVEISNPTDRRLLIRTIALSSSDGLSPVRLSPSSDCEVSGNVAYIKLMLAPNDELSVELETRDMNKVSEIWVHGVEVDTLNQWHVNAELTRKT